MLKQTKRTPVSLHAVRLMFPPMATLIVLLLTEWIARGTLNADIFAQYIFSPRRGLSAGVGIALPDLAEHRLADPFCAAGDAAHGGLGLRTGGGQFLYTQLRGEPVPCRGI